MAIGSNRPTKGLRPYAKQSRSLQNKEITTHYYLEAIQQPMAKPHKGSKRNGHLPRKDTSSSSRSRRLPPWREIGTNNESEEVGKGDTQEDPFRKMDKGKSSPASFAESLVTLQGTADRNETIKDQVAPLAITKYPREPGRSDRRKAIFE
jgi:hypothetical protein